MIIRNRIILIQGRPGEGKTFLATFIAAAYPRIYSNVNLFDANGHPMSSFIRNIDDLQKIEFSETKWVAILDEWGININARDSHSKENRVYGELGMLWRKLNIDIIICAQLGRMIDVYFRELANYRFEMHAWFEKKDYLMFEAKIYWSGDNIVKIARFDLFEFTRLTGVSYNTLESSRIEKKSKKERKIEILIPGQSARNDFITDTAPLYSIEADKIIGRI